ncbi:1-(5-phosphoribosyl)-5-[(5-phosphoribosylamino)methylideneamino] imidazole-4-carboxamide isomerase [Lentibacillus halodurans]|uniref:1-(5-phosphoribosyl)-5-[(5-phosphoribosylamino)methylideneamino] imidazole-4-carboxamide isomerase n=1 Tax=Lentibacillus halodurans TaxID=237679 RepID=A0A1I0XW52_9BACI|nr:1-(5-phosphoribosyl)-5-[(5-phosphoribosylamino)methylideneamino]imidazole-4-carboxamide isomerase [Lentibacillus halodurans]SFB05134.1 1-(5-phosphoribosyl)-5-[(5-phosphoribosylamino)methylideneamino] imidazole-4-carboxamide isomerase [Lentibacillus halodurans]
MILFPAIDIRDGKCVRLIQGDYNNEKIYNDSPAAVAQQWEKCRAAFLHIVDLDGAKDGISVNMETIRDITSSTNIPVQVGGGIRSMERISTYLAAGAARVIIGTAAINDKAFLKQAINTYGDQVAVSIDARNGYAAVDGWTATSDVKAADLVKELETIGVSTIIYTDILKDGMLKGPNFQELEIVNQLTSIKVIASGGVSSKEDVRRLRNMNLYGAIIGKALYDGTISFQTLRGEY